MSDWLKNIFNKIKNLNLSIDNYKKDTVIQSLPSVAYVNRAKKLIDKKQYDEAKLVLEKALNLPQEDDLVYKYLGTVYELMGDYFNAAENFRKSAKLNFHDKEIWRKLGFAQISCEQYDDAEKSFEAANKMSPSNTDVFTGWGMCLMKQKRYAEAKEKFVEASSINKYNVSALLLAAIMEVKLGEYESADAKLNLLANVSPNTANTYEYANLKFLKQDYDNAIHYAKKSLGYNTSMLPSYLLLGKIYALKFEEESSIACYETAEDKDLKNDTLYIEWAKALVRFEKYDEAKEKLSKISDEETEDIDYQAVLGLVYVMGDDLEQGKKYLETVLSEQPENAFALQGMGVIDLKKDNPQSAVNFFKEALNAENNDIINYYFLAKCYEKIGDDTKIKDNYDKSIEQNPKHLNSYIDFAKYYITKENYAEAQRKLRKASKIFEENIEILNLLFFVGYILVKENVCEYNIKETLIFAEKIESINPQMFEYPDKKIELAELLNKQKEN